MRQFWKKGLMVLCLLASMQILAQKRTFIHPGITHTRADLDRMKAMVNARQEPFYSTYQAMLKDKFSIIGDGNYADITSIAEGKFNGTVGGDGRRAHDLALLYHITGNKAYADDAVKRLNRYNNLTNASSRGTAPLDNGKVYLLIEAAELLRDYEGWKPEDQAAFKKMLTYPFYSTTKTAEGYKSGTDAQNKVSFYWNIYQFDPGRFGNQGLFAARGMMAMGIYLDNDTMFDRGYRYLTGLKAREDDHRYKPGPPTQVRLNSEDEFKRDYTVSWPKTGEQYISDEALHYYIYKNGQNQESARDQGHVFAGLGNYTAIAEMCWNQGYSMYSLLDNRILKGIEFAYRYNYSGIVSFPDQPEPWEPTGYTLNEDECTYENGMFYQAQSRSKRWEALSMASADRGKGFATGGWKTQVLEHYRVRAGLPAENMLWLQRAYDKMIKDYGHENWGESPNWYYEWSGWGTLTKKRTDWMAGDAGTWKDGQRVSGIPAVPCKIKAADYDYFAEDGEMRTYHNMGKEKGTVYRTDGTVEIAMDGEEPYVTCMENGEWMSYTLNFSAPENNMAADLKKKYNVYVTYRAKEAGGKLFAVVDGGEKKGKELEAVTEWTEKLLGTLEVKCGTAVLRLYVQGKSEVLEVKELRVAPLVDSGLKAINLAEYAESIKVFDQSDSDVTAENEDALKAAIDGDINAPIGLRHQAHLVFDFGENGLEINSVKYYNDGKTQDTREQAKVLGSTVNGKYTGAWSRNSATDVLRTYGRVQGGVPITDNNWVTGDGSNGTYAVGPVGKYRYLAVYNWSATCNISEVEVYSIVSSSSEKEDEEASAEWEPQPAAELNTYKWYAGRVEKSLSATSSKFMLKNIGGADLVVKPVEVLDAPWSTSFPKEDVVITPGKDYEFDFTFSPNREGVAEQKFVLQTNAGNFTVALSGDGIAPTTIREITSDDNGMFAEVIPGVQTVRLYSDTSAFCRIMTMGATVVREVKLPAGATEEVQLPEGIYLISMQAAGNTQVFKVAVH